MRTPHSIIFFLLILLLGCKSTQVQSSKSSASLKYLYEINISKLENDKISVQLKIEGNLDKNAIFCFPKIVPGIYGAMDFGQFISSFHAIGTDGEELDVQKTDTNCWTIPNSDKLKEINYWVDDSWEEFDSTLSSRFYHSAGSSFKDSSFVINFNSICGYFRGFTHHALELTFDKPENLIAATSLSHQISAPTKDVFLAKDYHELVDHPIMYSLPDITRIDLPNIKVDVACHTSSGTKISKEIADHIEPLIINQTKYLNNHLPVDKYTFILYLNPNQNQFSNRGDGLEHSNSTLILLNMPFDLAAIKTNVYWIASHEFFHTLMPLGLHSYEIQDYDFNQPRFSRHLWLYEGMTEYFTIHMPVKNGIQTLDEFITVIEKKIRQMGQFDPNLSLTKLSLNPMELQDQYYNVYLKGALLNLCLDIRLRELSNGKMGVQDLVLNLVKKYGPDKPFEDDKLFGEIVAMTGFPEIGDFIKRYIENSNELPLQEMLLKVGLNLQDGKITQLSTLTARQEQLRKSWLR